jgi:hypothetical protein
MSDREDKPDPGPPPDQPPDTVDERDPDPGQIDLEEILGGETGRPVSGE